MFPLARRLVLASVAVGLISGAASAATITVPGDQPTIQAAIGAASPGDEILVAPGTYVENVAISFNVRLVSSGGRAVTTIEGISGAGALGTIWMSGGTTGVEIGDTGQGFTIIGIDNGNPGIENAAVYFSGSHSGAQVIDNEIRANGDHGLLTEFGTSITGFVISGNEFSGTTFFDPPAGDGFGSQFTLPNVPRQLVTMGCGTGCATTSGITFTGNLISGTAGGINLGGNEQGNTMVTLDAHSAVITGNTFAGTTTRFGTSLRTRAPNANVSGNDFQSTGLTPTTGHVFMVSTGSTLGEVVDANTFDRAVYVDGTSGTIGVSLQAAVAAVPTGTTLELTGTFEEQVVIDGKNVILQGSGSSTTTLRAPVSLVSTFNTGVDNRPVVTVKNTEASEVRALTIDGLGRGNGNVRFEGVAFWNGGGVVSDCAITGIIETPFSGTQHGVAVYAFNDDGGPHSIEVGSCTIDEFQKNGFALSGTGLVVDVHDCDVVGKGDTATIAQNGIQVSFGAGGSVTDCSVSEMRYTPATFVSSGVLLYQATAVTLEGITLSDAQEPIYLIDGGASVSDVDVSYVDSAPDYDGFAIYNSTVPTPGEARAVAAPMIDTGSFDTRRAGVTVTITGGCLTGPNTSGTTGLYVASTGEPVDVNVSNMTITGWDTGLIADGSAVSLDVHASSVSGNATAGYDNSLSGHAQDATGNWWGASDGPSGAGSGSGDAIVVGTFPGSVSFDPYLVSGTSSTACTFTPLPNEIAPEPPASACLSTITPCITVPFEITRSDNADMRGYSVTFALSAELELCAGLSSIVEGGYLDDAGSASTQFQTLDHLDGTYTVDCAILGLPCGATAPTGTLFTIDVAASGGDGTGTITILSVVTRDCLNQPIASAGGAAAVIPIDTVAPTAIADLASSQVKTGNGTDGTTDVMLTFTTPVSAAVVEVYRKGFGFYPEYDDLGGSVPAVPATPAAALGTGWVLTGVTASGQTDEPADRDNWYYVVFTEDGCGNVSAVSNMAGGTLNYHLGDVTPTGGSIGDNDVDGLDISALGAAYGTIHGGAFYNAHCDVGPTGDFSVDARPTTDNVINFEDLILFAINFGEVSRLPGGVVTPAAPESPSIELVTSPVEGGGYLEATLVLGDHVAAVKGLHAVLRAEGLELVSARAGELFSAHGGQTFFKTLDHSEGLVVDAAHIGAGSVMGTGALAVLTYRVTGTAGHVELLQADLRDGFNRRLLEPQAPTAPALPSAIRFVGARPNPFGTMTTLRYELNVAAFTSLRIYDVAGRLVRTLVEREQSAGVHDAVWDGLDDAGRAVFAGPYFVRFTAGKHVTSQKLLRNR